MVVWGFLMTFMEILGVRVDNLGRKEILEKVEVFLSESKFHQIATVNPEFILQAQKDAEFKNILNSCALNVADGMGIWFAFLRFGKFLKCRMTGIDLMMEILKLAEQKNLKVFLAAGSGGLSTWEEAAKAINKTFPSLTVSGANLDKTTTGSSFNTTDSGINCDILFCNFGAPFQEKFLNSLKSDKIRLAMGVGGSFDYITGKIKRAPKFLRNVGFEWLWRLIQQPKRWKRIWNAVIVFPIKIIF